MESTASRVQAAHDLLTSYVLTLDRKEIDRWPDFFASEASYEIYSRENYEDGLPIAIVADYTKARILDRVIFVQRFWGGHYNENQPRHIVGPVEVREEGEELRLRANFAVYMTYPMDGVPRLAATGEYRDVIVFEDGAPKFKSKTVILDSPVLQEVFVYPL